MKTTWKCPSHNIKDGKLETLLVGDDLGICHMYNFKAGFHTCTYKLGQKDVMTCHFKDINEEFKAAINYEWDAQHNKKDKKSKAEKAEETKEKEPTQKK